MLHAQTTFQLIEKNFHSKGYRLQKINLEVLRRPHELSFQKHLQVNE